MPVVSREEVPVKRLLPAVLSLLLALGVMVPASAGAETNDDVQQQILSAQAEDSAAGAGVSFVGKEVLVTFKDGVTSDEATSVIDSTDEVVSKEVTSQELDGALPVATVRVADTASVADAVSALEGDPNVESAQPNYIYYPMGDGYTSQTLAETVAAASGTELSAQSTTIDDPQASSQWQLAFVGCYDAWSTVKCAPSAAVAGSTVSVAVIDTGVLYSHEDLNANIVATYNAVTDSSSSADANDSSGHGTHVAGLVSAVTDNGVGVSGVSYNAGLFVIKASSTGTSFTTSTLVASYNHLLGDATEDVNGDGNTGTVAEEYDVRAINMSVGGYWSSTLNDHGLCTAIDKAFAAGIVTVCAAGNGDSKTQVPYPEFPGDYATCVSVMNLTSANILSSTSNYNQSGSTAKDICAPGAGLFSTWYTNTSSYYSDSGTSMASPVVAGVVALEFADNPDLTAGQAVDVLYATATDLGGTGWDERYGYGKVSASAAVNKIIGEGDVSAADVAYTGSAITGNVTVTNGSGETLVEGTDYTVSYENNINKGTATVTVTGTGDYTSATGYVGSVTKTFAISATVARLSGDGALDTMTAIVDTAYPSTCDTVILARDDGYQDALCASGIAGLAQAPVLLVKTDELPEQTRAELARLKPSTVVVCGGTAAVSDAVANAAAQVSNANLYRCAGAGAAETAVDIFAKAPTITRKSWGKIAFVATNQTYQDALSISPYSWWAGCPIFLTSNTDSISSEIVQAIVDGGFDEVRVIGGTSAVSEGVVATLASAGVKVSETGRLAGTGALETSEAVAEWEYAEGMKADGLALANRDGYWDALTGAALCGRNGSVLLLVEPSNENRVTLDGFATMYRASIDHAYVFGGTAAVPQATKDYLESVLA